VNGPAALMPDATGIDLLVGRSAVLNLDRPIERVSLTTPDVADAMVTAPQQLLIHGKTPGSISLFVWDRSGGIRTYEVNVRRDLSEQMMKPVRWQQTIDFLTGAGVTRFVEVGPGRILTNMLKRGAPQADVRTIDSVEALSTASHV